MSGDSLRRFPPSLTSEELRDIQQWERKHRIPVVRRLLWEIFRLHSIALTARQYEEMTRRHAMQTAQIIGADLKQKLEELPLIREREDWSRQLLTGKASPQDKKKARQER